MGTESWISRAPRFPLRVPVEVLDLETAFIELHEIATISVGGLFVRSAHPLDRDSRIRLRIFVGGEVIDARARVAHAITPSNADSKDQTGMGVQLDELGVRARQQLIDLILRLVAISGDHANPFVELPDTVPDADPSRQRSPSIRCVAFLRDSELQLCAESQDELRKLWRTSLSRGELFVATPAPPAPGSVLVLQLELPDKTLPLRASVMYTVSPEQAALIGHPPGAGLHFYGFEGAPYKALERYVNAAAPQRPDSLEQSRVAIAVSWFLRGMESGDLYRALSLANDATIAQRRQRIHSLKALFEQAPADLTPELQRRLATAREIIEPLDLLLAQREQDAVV